MRKIFLVLGIITILFYACRDEDVIHTPDLTSTQACQDYLLVEQLFNDESRIVEEGFNVTNQDKSYPEYNLMNHDSSDIDTLIIDFGPINILHPNPNGKLRKGQIIITYKVKYKDSLTIITYTYDNYHVNNNLAQGKKIVINQKTVIALHYLN